MVFWQISSIKLMITGTSQLVQMIDTTMVTIIRLLLIFMELQDIEILLTRMSVQMLLVIPMIIKVNLESFWRKTSSNGR